MNNKYLQNQNNSKKTLYFILARGIIEYICLLILYIFYCFTDIFKEPISIIILIIVPIIYILSVLILNNFIKIKDIQGNIIINNIGIQILCILFSYVTLSMYFEIAKNYDELTLGFGLIILILFVIPIIFVINLMIDIILKNNKKANDKNKKMCIELKPVSWT